MRTPRLFTYCMPFDDGAAPNPHGGICTLAICKPAIRRTAREGEWVVGTGSKNARTATRGRTHDLSGHVIYAMRVTEKMTMRAYDAYTRQYLSDKVANSDSLDWRLRRGDSIYDYFER